MKQLKLVGCEGEGVVSIALMELSDNGRHAPVVDHCVFYGSPGLAGATCPGDFGMADDAVFVMLGNTDPIRGAPPTLGPRPMDEAFMIDFLNVNTTTIDGVTYYGPGGHSDYARLAENGELHMSGYQLARILAGLPPYGR